MPHPVAAEPWPLKVRLPAAALLLACVFVAASFGDRAIPGWSFDYVTPAYALLAGLLGAAALPLPWRWRPLLALPGAAAMAMATLHAREAALNRDLPCAPHCYVGEPCPPTSDECMAALRDAASARAFDYSLLVLGTALLPVVLAMAGALRQPWRGRVPLGVLFAILCAPLVPYLLVLVGSGLGGTPGPWLQSR